MVERELRSAIKIRNGARAAQEAQEREAVIQVRILHRDNSNM